MEIQQVNAVDDDVGVYGLVTYGFWYNDGFRARTPEFVINPITGVITADAVFDREAKDTYTVSQDKSLSKPQFSGKNYSYKNLDCKPWLSLAQSNSSH